MKTFQLGNGVIQVTQELEAYNTLRLKYHHLANQAKKDFTDRFYTLFAGMDQLHTDMPVVAHEYLAGAVDHAVRDLVKNGILNISDNQFIDQYLQEYPRWENAFREIDDKYMEIVLGAEALEEYRKSRAEGSPKIIGGGFSVEGATKGIAVAAAANLAIDIAHGVFNLGAKALSSMGDSQKKSKLFLDVKTITHLAASIYSMVFLVHFAVADLVNSTKGKLVFGLVSDEDKNSAIGFFENICKGRIDSDKSDACLIEAITLNPYDKSYYLVAPAKFT